MSNVVDPLVLLTNKGERQPTWLNDKYNPIAFTIAGFGMACMLNWGFRKPIFSGVQRHVALSAVGLGLGVYFDGKRNEYLAKRDAILRHYVELHPDDFPPVARTKYADVLERWVPIR